jgi:hypothetical protein
MLARKNAVFVEDVDALADHISSRTQIYCCKAIRITDIKVDSQKLLALYFVKYFLHIKILQINVADVPKTYTLYHKEIPVTMNHS